MRHTWKPTGCPLTSDAVQQTGLTKSPRSLRRIADPSRITKSNRLKERCQLHTRSRVRRDGPCFWSSIYIDYRAGGGWSLNEFPPAIGHFIIPCSLKYLSAPECSGIPRPHQTRMLIKQAAKRLIVRNGKRKNGGRSRNRTYDLAHVRRAL